MEGSASSSPTLQRGRTSLSTLLESASDSPNLPKAPPTTATSATPASERSSPFPGLSGGAEPARGHADFAAAVVDDVFLAASEVLSAQDSTRKEFHCAVLRALSKEPSVGDQAPGTPAEAESGLNSWPSTSLLPCSAFARLITYRCNGRCGNPCLLCPLLFPGGLELTAIVLPCASILPTHSSVS